MTKQFTADSTSVSGSTVAHMAIGGTISDGLSSAVGRHISMKVSTWHVAVLLSMLVKTDEGRAEFAEQVRILHPERQWLSRNQQELDALMRRIADLIHTDKGEQQ